MRSWIYGVIAAVVLSVFVAYQASIQTSTVTNERAKEQIKETSEAEITGCEGRALCITGRVERIIDGDTLVVRGYKVRLSLVNTPERNEAGFEEAKSFTGSLCPVASSATIDQDDGQPIDKYNRMLGKVFCSGKILNAELLYNGHASILTRYCSESEFGSEPWAQDFGC